MSLKEAFLRGVVASGAERVFRPLTHRRVPILMLHRFSPDARQDGRTSAALLERCAQYLVRRRFRAVTLAELCQPLSEGHVPSRTVCLTVDDGYLDFKEVAFPILRQHGLRATVFVASRFIDGDLWYWWDRIEHALKRARRTQAAVPLGDRRVDLAWSNEAQRKEGQLRFIAACKAVTDDAKLAAIAELERILEVEPAVTRPPEYGGMSWEDLKALSREGIEFGGHTVTHPILSRLPEDRAAAEIQEGLARIEKMTGLRPATFAYPNGRSEDFTAHTVRTLRQAGIRGATTGEHGIVSSRRLRSIDDPLYRLPRVPMSSTFQDFVQYVCGLEALKQELGYS